MGNIRSTRFYPFTVAVNLLAGNVLLWRGAPPEFSGCFILSYSLTSIILFGLAFKCIKPSTGIVIRVWAGMMFSFLIAIIGPVLGSFLKFSLTDGSSYIITAMAVALFGVMGFLPLVPTIPLNMILFGFYRDRREKKADAN